MNDAMSKVRKAASSQELPAPATQQEVDELEAATGQRLPPFLRDVYLSIANGCFGPGYGLMPLTHPIAASEETVLELYRSLCLPDREDPTWVWPRPLLPICDWGCAIRSCVDCSSEEGMVIRFDPNGHDAGMPWESAFVVESPSIRDWLFAWASGTMWSDL
jgi:hypothetical protein